MDQSPLNWKENHFGVGETEMREIVTKVKCFLSRY